MNLIPLIDFFYSYRKAYFSPNYDVISDIEKLTESYLTSMYVIETLKKDILPDIDVIHDNHMLIDIKVKGSSVELCKDKESICKENMPEKNLNALAKKLLYSEIKNLFSEKIKNSSLKSNIIINFEKDLSGDSDLNDVLGEILEELKKDFPREIFIVKIHKSDMYKSIDINNHTDLYQYFYKKGNVYYCAYIRSKGKDEHKEFCVCPAMYYFMKRIIYADIRDKEILEHYEFTNLFKTYDSQSEYTKLFLKEVCKNANLSNYFFENCIRNESEGLINCLNFFKKQEEYECVIKSYLEDLPDENKEKLLANSQMIDMFNSEKFASFGKENSDHLHVSVSKIQYKSSQEDIREFMFAELRSFFTYMSTRYKDVFFKYRSNFIDILNEEILKTLQIAFKKLEKKVYCIFSFINIYKEEIRNKESLEKRDLVKKNLSDKDIKIIKDLVFE